MDTPKHFPSSDRLLLTYNEVCRRLSISKRTLARLVRNGRIQVVRIGRAARIPLSEVERLAQEGSEI